MTTDTSERGLEEHICTALAGQPCAPSGAGAPAEQCATRGGAGWAGGSHPDYDREHCVDLVQLSAFLRRTQPEAADTLALSDDGPRGASSSPASRAKSANAAPSTCCATGSATARTAWTCSTARHRRATSEPRSASSRTASRSPAAVLQPRGDAKGARHRALHQWLPSHLRTQEQPYQADRRRRGRRQYKKDRNPREKLFEFGRCIAHFAVDESEVRFCTHLKGKASWFLPFNRGWNDGAGNPPNPDGLKTDYLWLEVLTRESLTNILENYAQVVETRDEKTGKKKRTQIWPRFHQIDVVRHLLADVQAHGAGKRYLIQHSASSGKSNSIAWLAHQLIGLEKDDAPVFHSIIVVTDRRILDSRSETPSASTLRWAPPWATRSARATCAASIETGKKIIISTVQKFPFILDEIGNQQRGRRFAIIIDEAHFSQGGRTSAAMAQALSEAGQEADDETFEDQINRLMESRRLLPNASYFAFTATPKNKTLEIFGDADRQPDGKVKHHAFHSYTMKQAIQEGFILDVLRHYTLVQELLPAREDRRGRPEVRYQEGQEEAAPLRRRPRPRDWVEGGNHGRPLPRPSARAAQGRRRRARHGGDQRRRARNPVLPRHRKVPPRAQEPLPGDRRVRRRPRVRRGESERGDAERLPLRSHRRAHPVRPLPAAGVRRQVPDRLRRAPAAHDVRGQNPRRHQSGADALEAQPRAPRRNTTSSCSTS